MDTKNIHTKTKVNQLWKEPLIPPSSTNDLNDPDKITTLYEELFIPKHLHLDKITFMFKQSLQESEEFLDQVNALKRHFEIAKNKLKTERSKCTREIAVLNKKLAIQKCTENIIEGFVSLTENLCLYSIETYDESTKANYLLACCIMIYFVKN